MSLKMFEIDDDYILKLKAVDNKVADPKIKSRIYPRKYLGILFEVNDLKYFVNLTSFKEHKQLPEMLDHIHIGHYGSVNLNNMIPVIDGVYHYVNFSEINKTDKGYYSLLQNEYRIIRKLSSKIIQNAIIVYNHKLTNVNNTSLARRCCDFQKLEQCAYEIQDSLIPI